MYRIFFDANAGAQETGYLLWFPTSVRDLEKIGHEVCAGLHVILYTPDELEMEAVLEFDEEMKCWRGIPVKGTIKYLDGSL